MFDVSEALPSGGEVAARRLAMVGGRVGPEASEGWQLPPLGLIGEAVLTEKASAAQRADVFQPSIAEGSGSLHMAKQPSTADQHIVRVERVWG